MRVEGGDLPRPAAALEARLEAARGGRERVDIAGDWKETSATRGDWVRS